MNNHENADDDASEAEEGAAAEEVGLFGWSRRRTDLSFSTKVKVLKGSKKEFIE